MMPEERIGVCADQWMHDLLQPDDRLRIADDAARKLGAIDHAFLDSARKRRLDQGGRSAGIEAMHGLVGIVDGNAGIGEQLRRGRLAHADRAGEAEHDHFFRSISATTSSRRLVDTSGITSNHFAKAGAAWCSSMPRPSTVFSPRRAAAASSGVFSGT